MLLDNKVLITGIGIVGPLGNSFVDFWENMLSGRVGIAPLAFGFKNRENLFAGAVKDIKPEMFFPKRLLKKCSRFSTLSLLAVRDALADARFNITDSNKDRIGIFVGNNSGGWESAHQGLKTLHMQGTKFINPFLASNWFPAAPQGHLSLAYGIRGFSKTVIADRSSSLLAIQYAAKSIMSGRLDVAVAGGVETPLDPWALAFYSSLNKLSIHRQYKPFDINRGGMILGEGAAFLILESKKHYIERKAQQLKPLVQISGFSFTSSGSRNPTLSLSIETYIRAIKKASVSNTTGFDLLMLDGAANAFDDLVEAQAIQKVFNQNTIQPLVCCPKTAFGNTIGASGAFDVALSAASIKESIVPCIKSIDKVDPKCHLNFVLENNANANIESALVISRGFNDIVTALNLEKWRH